ncbi:MAG TPA: FixH family protein [Vicinamibacterales bacterium]|nr:FixH family protein [Vicinamibacterales bacterium]
MSYDRSATQALIRGAAIALLLACSTAGCEREPSDVTVAASWHLDPTSPESHEQARLQLILRDAAGHAVRGARLRVEAHMSHPGMAPVLVETREQPDGVYTASLELTMAGNWTLVASGTLADGTVITRTSAGVVVR